MYSYLSTSYLYPCPTLEYVVLALKAVSIGYLRSFDEMRIIALSMYRVVTYSYTCRLHVYNTSYTSIINNVMWCTKLYTVQQNKVFLTLFR